MRRGEGSGGLRADKDGTVRLTAAAERLWCAWLAYLKDLLRVDRGFIMTAPVLIGDDVLVRSKYLEHFPQHVLHAVNESAREGSRLALSPACCLHLYAQEAGRRFGAEGTTGVIYGPCVRFEAGRWSGLRLSHFTMLEWVTIGSAGSVSRLAETTPLVVSRAFEHLGFRFEFVEASDPFFAGEQSGAAVLQRMTGAKHEWRSPTGTAMGSINRHGDSFGTRFDIHAGESPAHSICLALGIERLVAESLTTWGEAAEGWPSEFSSRDPLP